MAGGAVASPTDSQSLAAALFLGSGLVIWRDGLFGINLSEGCRDLRPRSSSVPIHNDGFRPAKPLLTSSRHQHVKSNPGPAQSPSFKQGRKIPSLYLLAFAPLVLSQLSRLLPTVHLAPSVPMYWSNRLGLYMRYKQPFYAPPTLDVIFSHHSEQVDEFQAFVNDLRDRSIIPRHRTRMIIYSKGNDSIVESLKGIQGIHQIIQLPNGTGSLLRWSLARRVLTPFLRSRARGRDLPPAYTLEIQRDPRDGHEGRPIDRPGAPASRRLHHVSAGP